MNTGILTDPHYPGITVSSDDCIAQQYNQANLSTGQIEVCSINGYAAAFAPSVALQFARPVTETAPLPQVSLLSAPAPAVIAAASTPAAPMPNLPPQPVAVQSVPVAIITNDNLTQPLPDITQMLRPRPPVCSGWQGLNGMINDNPIIAIAALGILFTLAWGQRGR